MALEAYGDDYFGQWGTELGAIPSHGLQEHADEAEVCENPLGQETAPDQKGIS